MLDSVTHRLSFFFFSTDKFLVDYEGTPYKRFVPTVAPFDMKDDIETLLKKKEESK